jgi:HEPN domain-containing protein
MQVDDWITKAEGDYQAMQTLAAMKNPVWDAVGFHAQQCAEKYFKAYLLKQDQRIPKTHDLTQLLDAVIAIDPHFKKLDTPELITLTLGAVESRYPGVSLTHSLCEEMIATCDVIRQTLRSRLRLDGKTL